MPVVISTKFNMKLYNTTYIGAKCRAFAINNSEICPIIDLQDGHLKVQDGGQVSCQYQFHMDLYNVKCMFAHFG